MDMLDNHPFLYANLLELGLATRLHFTCGTFDCALSNPVPRQKKGPFPSSSSDYSLLGLTLA